MKHIKPLRQNKDGYIYGIEGTTEYIHIPFSKIEWFLNQLLRISTKSESEALCSMTFDYPDRDMFYADNYPPENEWDHKIAKNKRTRNLMKHWVHKMAIKDQGRNLKCTPSKT